MKVARVASQSAAAGSLRSLRVLVDYSLGSAERGTLRCYALQDGDVIAEEQASVVLGARSTTVVIRVPASPSAGPGYPDRSLEIVAALYPEPNEEAPSATDSTGLSLAP